LEVEFWVYGTETDTPVPTPLFATPVSSTTRLGIDGEVGSTSNEVTHDRPQQTDRMRLWFAALNAGTKNLTTMNVTIENPTPAPPPMSMVF
jgi:hypothetical protein